MKRLCVLITMFVLIFNLFGCAKDVGKQNAEKQTNGKLTSEQKVKDFQYLTKLISNSYPFIEGNVKIKGLSDIRGLSDEYVKRAGETKDDAEYIALVDEYLTLLNHSGHGYLFTSMHKRMLADGNVEEFRQYFSDYCDITDEALERADYWGGLYRMASNSKYMQPETRIVYNNGVYEAREECKFSDVIVPKGSVVEKIEGKSPDEYIKSLENKIHLSFDYDLKKLYLPNPLIVRPLKGNEWGVEFRFPNGRRETVMVPKGSPVYSNALSSGNKNVEAVELSDTIGYIKLFSFEHTNIEGDRTVISDFLAKANGKYKKLIIDIRNNGGGDPTYWMDLLASPLIKDDIVYTETAALKKDFIKRWGDKFEKYMDNKPSILSKRLHFEKIEEIKKHPAFDKSWMVFDVTRRIEPDNSLPFEGDIYLMVNGGTFSAAEDFALFCRETGFARIVGDRTAGGAGVFMIAYIFSLPESKILFGEEVELVLNPDGTVNEVMGTAPDIPMKPCPLPISYNKEALLQDQWIEQIINMP